MTTTKLTFAALTLGAAVTTSAHAAITSVSGQTTWLLTPPASCTFGTLQGFNTYAWNEQQAINVNLPADMINTGPNSGAIPGTLTGLVDSHFLHFEPLPGAIGSIGTVSFATAIRAVMFTPMNLDISDGVAGSTSTTYPTGYPFRGIGGNPPSTFIIAGNTISFDFKSFAPSVQVVQVRVFTEAVPAPGAAALLALGGLIAARRRR